MTTLSTHEIASLLKPSNEPRHGRVNRLICITACVAILASMCIFTLFKEEGSIKLLKIEGETHFKVRPKQCPKFCDARLAQRMKHHGGDLLDPQELLAMANKARDTMILSLKEKYGENVFKAMFEEPDGTSRGHSTIFGGGDDEQSGTIGPSKARFRRKLKIKLLQAQVAMQEAESNVSGCNCTTSGNASSHRRLESTNLSSSRVAEISLPDLPLTYASFVWATGGHSVAAGHGNLYNESYTAVMEATAKDIFRAVGIDLVGRNYAMGAMNGAPEIAMCQESLFGIDADLLSWDFALNDERSLFKNILYTNRIGMHQNKPVVFDVNIDGNMFGEYKTLLKRAEEHGLSTMYISPKKWKEIEDGIPDMAGMSSEEMAKVGPFARHFKCNNALEKGDPTCGDNKYNDDICRYRIHKAIWHPGWRVNALYGNIMGLFLSDMLVDSIKELTIESHGPKSMLSILLEEEAADHAKFYESPPGITDTDVRVVSGLTDKDLVDVVAKMSRSTNVICHTALLPAQIRYLGILTESEKVGTHDFDKGFSQTHADYADKAKENEKDTRQMRLIYKDERQTSCPVDLNWDYKDFFYSTQSDGWTTITIPNDSEIAHYIGDKAYEPDGVIMFCFIPCSWGGCDHMRFEEIRNGTMKVEVNGVTVTNITNIQNDCGLLQHDSGNYHFIPNSDKRFEIRVLTMPDRSGKRISFTRITSIVVV